MSCFVTEITVHWLNPGSTQKPVLSMKHVYWPNPTSQPVPGDHRSPAIQPSTGDRRSPSYPALLDWQRPTRHPALLGCCWIWRRSPCCPTLPSNIVRLDTQLCWVVAGGGLGRDWLVTQLCWGWQHKTLVQHRNQFNTNSVLSQKPVYWPNPTSQSLID